MFLYPNHLFYCHNDIKFKLYVINYCNIVIFVYQNAKISHVKTLCKRTVDYKRL